MALDIKSDKVGYILLIDDAFHICTSFFEAQRISRIERYKVKPSNKDILKRIDALENLLKKHPGQSKTQTGKPMTFKETCAYLGYAPSYLYKLTYKNIIPHHKPTGKMLYFFKDEIDEWITKSRN